MKRIILCLLCIMMICSFFACSSSNEQTGGESAGATSPAVAGSHAGTHSEPYSFGDEITFTAKNWYDDYIVEYTIVLNELWGSSKVASEFPNYSIEDRILVRGQITVNCDSTDDGIDFDLYATYVTSSLNEEDASIQTYKNGELNNTLRTVYSGGTYDIMIFASDDGIGSMDISFLKISYTDADGNDSNIWVQMPENADEGIGLQTEASNGSEGTNADTTRDSSSATTPELQSGLTPEELDSLLLEQPMYVESTKYIVQDERYKALYPDMLQAVVKNNSGTDIKNVVVAFVAWDENNFPVKIYSSGVDINGAYVKLCQYNDANMPNGTSYGSKGGLSIDEESGIATFKAIVVSYDDFDGNTWDNPYYDTWVSLYSDKKLN